MSLLEVLLRPEEMLSACGLQPVEDFKQFAEPGTDE